MVFLLKQINLELWFLDWLDSYAGFNLIRFNGTHSQKHQMLLSDLSEGLLALRQAMGKF